MQVLELLTHGVDSSLTRDAIGSFLVSSSDYSLLSYIITQMHNITLIGTMTRMDEFVSTHRVR